MTSAPDPGSVTHRSGVEFVMLMAAMMSLVALCIDVMLPAFPWIAADLGVAADHRVKFTLLHLPDQVSTVLLQGLIGALGVGAGDPLMAADIAEHLQQAVTGQVELQQDPPRRRLPAFVGQHQKQVLDTDIFVLQMPGFLFRLNQELVEALRDINLAGFNARAGHRRAYLKFLPGGRNQGAQVDIQPRGQRVQQRVHGGVGRAFAGGMLQRRIELLHAQREGAMGRLPSPQRD